MKDYNLLTEKMKEELIPSDLQYIYKYRNIEKAISLVKSNSIWFSNPSQFTDKSDIGIDLIDYEFDKLHIDYVSDIKKLSNQFPLKLLTVKRVIQLIYKDRIEDRYKGLKVGCFSYDGNSNYCWNYHSKNHTGVSFQFDVNRIFDQYPQSYFNANFVDYVAKIERFRFLELEKFEFYSKWIYRKLASEFQEEKEFRFFYYNYSDTNIKSKPKGYPFFFNKNSLVGISFGERCSNIDKMKLLQTLYEEGYTVDNEPNQDSLYYSIYR